MGKAAGVNLTKAEVEALVPREKLFRVPDATVRGLELQVTPKGAMSWVMRFRVHGHQKTHTLGRWPELSVPMARKLALDLLGDLTKGKDPAAKRKEEREAETVNELARRFSKEHIPTLKKGTQLEYEGIICKHILPALGHMRAKDVTSSDLANLLSKVRSNTPTGVMANRVRAVASKMFALASVWGMRPGLLNPAVGQIRTPEQKKDRHLSDKELVAVGATLRHLAPCPPGVLRPEYALPEMDPHALAFFRLALLTGMRRSEILGNKQHEIPALRWDSIDLNSGVARLGRHKTERKMGAKSVLLCSAALDLLEELPRMLNNPHVIPRQNLGTASWAQKCWVRLKGEVPKVEALLEVPAKERVNITDVTIHDLRRSFASLGTRMGYPESFTGALLGHSAGTVTGGYARLGGDPLADAVEAIGSRMAALLAGQVDLEAEAKDAREAKNAKREARHA